MMTYLHFFSNLCAYKFNLVFRLKKCNCFLDVHRVYIVNDFNHGKFHDNSCNFACNQSSSMLVSLPVASWYNQPFSFETI